MQDRFKFRYLFDNKLYEVVLIDFKLNKIYLKIDDKYPLRTKFDDKKLIQCTGLKDKNGKLIYEGDIINIWCKNFTKNQISEVKFCKERAAFTFDYITDFERIVPCTMDKTEIEVIGSIYENPELLEQL